IDYQAKLSGNSICTRSYAYVTLDYLKNPDTALLPAVILSYIENKESYLFWTETLRKWEELFQEDSGDKAENLKLRLICDGVWFSMLNVTNSSLNTHIESIIKDLCNHLSGEDY